MNKNTFGIMKKVIWIKISLNTNLCGVNIYVLDIIQIFTFAAFQSVTIPKYLLKPSFDCFLTCSILKVISNINVSNFGLHFKGFTLPTIYISEITFLLVCLTNTYFWQLFEQVVKELKCSCTWKRCGAF